MKAHYAVLLALVLGVGCGKKEVEKAAAKEPELRSDKVITPDEAANELFVEAIELVSKAKSEENTNIPAAIKSYEEALVKVRTIVNEYKKSDLAVKLVSGETLFTGKSMAQIEERVSELQRELTRRAEEEADPANPLEEDDPEELVAIVDPDDAAANHSVVVSPKGTQGKRFLVVEIYLQRSEPKDKGFKARAVKKTKLLQEIATRELEAHTVENLQKPITKEFIRRTLQKKFNGALEGKGFHTPVGKVVFSKWIMQ